MWWVANLQGCKKVWSKDLEFLLPLCFFLPPFSEAGIKLRKLRYMRNPKCLPQKKVRKGKKGKQKVWFKILMYYCFKTNKQKAWTSYPRNSDATGTVWIHTGQRSSHREKKKKKKSTSKSKGSLGSAFISESLGTVLDTGLQVLLL